MVSFSRKGFVDFRVLVARWSVESEGDDASHFDVHCAPPPFTHLFPPPFHWQRERRHRCSGLSILISPGTRWAAPARPPLPTGCATLTCPRSSRSCSTTRKSTPLRCRRSLQKVRQPVGVWWLSDRIGVAQEGGGCAFLGRSHAWTVLPRWHRLRGEPGCT